MRALGVDLGTVRIGLALSDPQKTIASPLATLEAGDPDAPGWVADVAQRLELHAREHACDTVVIGLPRALSGRDTASTAVARAVERALARRGSVTTVLWDERLSSVEAERLLLVGGRRRAQRKEERDKVAAAIVLQGWLDATSSAADTGTGSQE